jgi:hypothetical protein
MTYKQLKQLKPEAFKRRCGLQLETFNQMVEILNPHLDRRGKRGGHDKGYQGLVNIIDRLIFLFRFAGETRKQSAKKYIPKRYL